MTLHYIICYVTIVIYLFIVQNKNKRIENRKENQNKIVEFRHTITILIMLV